MAVGSVPAGCSTANPAASRISAIAADAATSSNPGSGLAWIRCESPINIERRASTASARRAFNDSSTRRIVASRIGP